MSFYFFDPSVMSVINNVIIQVKSFFINTSEVKIYKIMNKSCNKVNFKTYLLLIHLIINKKMTNFCETIDRWETN